MTKSHDHKPTNFVGLYFIDEERYETGQIIAQISDSYYLAQFNSIDKGAPPPRLEVLSSVEFNKLCDSCGSRHWQFFPDVESRKRWMIWLNTPDPANDNLRLAALHWRGWLRRERDPEVDYRERLAGGNCRTTRADVLQHRHRHLRLDRHQSQGEAP